MPDSWPAHALRFPRARGAGVLHLGRAGGGQAAGRVRAGGGQPDLSFGGGISGLGGPALAGDTNAPAVKAIKLYRDLLRFHQGDPAPRLAFAAADLERLAWGWNAAFGEDKNARYKAALEAFIRANGDFDISALAMEREARVLQQEGDLVAAHELAGRGAKLFPNSPGGKLCRNLVAEIEAKSASITTERVWNAPWPKISVRYKNVDAVYFRAIPVDWEIFLQRQPPSP